MKSRLLGACGALLLMSFLSSCGGGFVVKGTLELMSVNGILGDGDSAGSSCHGQNGYDDIDEGAQIVIKDNDGKQIAIGQLGSGKLTAGINDGVSTSCRFTFKVNDVPDKGDIYTISIGHRDDYSFKKAEASDLALSLGE